MGAITRGLITLACLGASACTIVRVDGARGVSVHAGVLKIAPTANASFVAYRSIGVGAVPGHNGLTLGAAKETAVMLFTPDACRMIFFEADRAAVDRLAALLETSPALESACTTGSNR